MDINWKKDAACRDVDPELFYPPTQHSGQRARCVVEAMRVCNRCAVRVDCLQYAFEVDDRFAILGATLPNERQRMARRPPNPATPAA